MKLHGQAVDTTTRFYKTKNIEVLNGIITMGSWFGNMCCVGLLREELIFHDLVKLNIGTIVTPKDKLINHLEPKTVPRGNYVVYCPTSY